MNQEWHKEVLHNISEDLELEMDESIKEDDLLLAIAARVAILIDQDAGLLFSYLYRLDISERSLNKVIKDPSDDPIAYRIAELILNRQKARIITKKKYGTGPSLEGWDW
ncbi:MAG: hypothetical protein V3V00_00255 [Saprospiraceae bacterium]